MKIIIIIKYFSFVFNQSSYLIMNRFQDSFLSHIKKKITSHKKSHLIKKIIKNCNILLKLLVTGRTCLIDLFSFLYTFIVYGCYSFLALINLHLFVIYFNLKELLI